MPMEQNNVVAYIGSGKIAESSLLCMASSIGDRIEEIRVYSRTPERRQRFVEIMKPRVSMKLSVTGSIDEAVNDADYVITATTALRPLVDDNQLKRNVTLLSLGGNEVGTSYLKRCYKKGLIFCDDWELVKHRNAQSLPQFYHKLKKEKGCFRIKDDRIINLWKLITHRFCFKRVAYESIHVNCVGLPCLDLETAHRMYNKACKQGVGQYIKL
jgi:ornithine cyclodeaminase/alanine dehydrogenase-like protein (mu-crystallin family)